MLRLICVPPAQVKDFLPYAEPFLRSAMQRGGTGNYADLERNLSEGALLWLGWDGSKVAAAMVTYFSVVAEHRILDVLAFGGNSEWLTFNSEIEQFARTERCDRIRVIGRKGWLRKLKDYRLRAVVMEKAL